MTNLGIVQSRKRRRDPEVDQHCTSGWVDVKVGLPRWDSGSRAADALADSAPDPALPVECELPTKRKETRDPVENERERNADELPRSPTKKMESVHFQSEWKDVNDAISCAQSAMSCAFREMKELERKKVEAETACEEQMRKVTSLEHDRDATVVRMQELESTLSAQKIALDASKKRDQELRATVSTMQIDLRKLETERDDLRQKETSMLAEQRELVAERDELKQKNMSMLAHRLKLIEEQNELKWKESCMLADQLKLTAERDELKHKADAQNLWTSEKAVLESELHEARIAVQVMVADQLKLVAERDELKQQADAQSLSWRNDQAILHSELDAARNAVQALKTEFNTKLETVESERDAALLAVAQQTAQVLKCNTMMEIVLIEKDIALTKKEVQLLANIHRCPRGTTTHSLHENCATTVESFVLAVVSFPPLRVPRQDLKMPLLLAPKTEPVTAGPWFVEKSEAELYAERKEIAATAVLTSLPPSRTMPDRADESRAPDETINKSHESSGLAIVCLPPRVGLVLSDAHLGQVTEEPRVKSDLDNVFGALSDAKSMVKQALGNFTREKEKLKAECEEGKKLLDDTLRNLSEKMTDFRALESERDATLAALKEKEEMLKAARDLMKAMRRQHDVLSHNHRGQIQGLEATNNAMRRGADNLMAAHAREKLEMGREFHATMMEDKVNFHAQLRHVLVENTRFKHDLATVGNALAKMPNIQKQLDEMKRAKEAVVLALVEEKAKRKKEHESQMLNISLMASQARKRKLEGDLACIREENNRLQERKEAVQKNFEETQRKTLCQICFDLPKNSISFPCLHLHFCFGCLEKHYHLHKTCPSCEIPVSGILRCNILP